VKTCDSGLVNMYLGKMEKTQVKKSIFSRVEDLREKKNLNIF